MTTAVPAVSIMKYETEIEQLIHDLGWHREPSSIHVL